MYVGYHYANNVSNFGGDPVIQSNLKYVKKKNCHFVFTKMRSVGYQENMIGRTYFGGDQDLVTQLYFVLYNTIKWSYQPKHSHSHDQQQLRPWYLP